LVIIHSKEILNQIIQSSSNVKNHFMLLYSKINQFTLNLFTQTQFYQNQLLSSHNQTDASYYSFWWNIIICFFCLQLYDIVFNCVATVAEILNKNGQYYVSNVKTVKHM